MINNLNCERVSDKNINNCYSNLKSYINYTQQKENKNKKRITNCYAKVNKNLK